MTGIRRKRDRKENREYILARRRRKQERNKRLDRFVFEMTGKPVRHNPKN